jgi:hypothetical protein
MSNVEITNEMREFFAKVHAGTIQGAIEWETTADPNMLMAALDPEFIVRLEKGAGRSTSEYALSLVKFREVLFRLSAQDLTEGNDPALSVQTFRVLWERALLRTQRVTEDLNRVNKLLDERLSTTSKAPFWKAQASSR